MILRTGIKRQHIISQLGRNPFGRQSELGFSCSAVPFHDQGIFVLGLIVFGISFLSVFWVDNKSAVIFQLPDVIEVDNPLPVEL